MPSMIDRSMPRARNPPRRSRRPPAARQRRFRPRAGSRPGGRPGRHRVPAGRARPAGPRTHPGRRRHPATPARPAARLRGACAGPAGCRRGLRERRALLVHPRPAQGERWRGVAALDADHLRLRRGRLHHRHHPQLQRRHRRRAGGPQRYLCWAGRAHAVLDAQHPPRHGLHGADRRRDPIVSAERVGLLRQSARQPTRCLRELVLRQPHLPHPPRLPQAADRRRRHRGRADLRRLRVAELLLPLHGGVPRPAEHAVLA